ncbi:MAG: LysM peptidoglycan-binding domain-containing protein [Bacteroidota bacterium]
MIKRIVFIFVLVFTCSVSAQNYIKHTVAVGETMTQIAKKYKVSTLSIYELNPDAKKGIQLNSVLLIPANAPAKPATAIAKKPTTIVAKPPVIVTKNNPVITKTTTVTTKPIVAKEKPATVEKTNANTKPVTHTVITKETLYSIADQYNVTVEDLQKANAEALKEGLKIGQQITIPANMVQKSPMAKTDKNDDAIYHEVVAKETKYAIANKYGITVEQLEKLNPEIAQGLNIGQKIIISGQAKTNELVKGITPKTTYNAQGKNLNFTYIDYEIKAKETLYSLTRMTGLTTDELIALNPGLKDGVKEGMSIKVPSASILNVKNELADLSKTINKQKRKELVLLLPFNISKLENDTINSTSDRLKKDKFLNMTLDFYSGALTAIDSAKTLGLNIDVKIFDSQETKNSSNVLNLIPKLQTADAVIGPFYQSNVEKVAELLSSKKIPVISPLSKEVVKNYANLYQSMPSNEMVRDIMFDYLHSKESNVIAVISPKKTTIKQYLSEQQKETKVAELDANGVLIIESFKKLFIKDKMNYVVMDSQNTNMIFTLTNAMMTMMPEYQVQLVILEPNATLDFEEIDLERLTKLKMLYPSLTRENETATAEMFRNDYRQKNKILPNQYATRGFDVTFDTILRLSQDKDFAQTVSTATEQVENRFDYTSNPGEGYTNKGIYIVNYDVDLTVKPAQ